MAEIANDAIFCRDDCLNNLGMADPPNPGQGFFYNVYIHHGQVLCIDYHHDHKNQYEQNHENQFNQDLEINIIKTIASI